jgi:hypothetical protein
MTLMRSRRLTATPFVLAAACLVAATACKKTDAAADSTATSGTPAMAADSTATSGTPAATSTMASDSMKADSVKKDSMAKADTTKKKP